MDYSNLTKPFPSYRWRWGASTPTENLNLPEVFFGCLQVLYRNQGLSPSAPSVHEGLKLVEHDLSGHNIPTLARTPERNIFRNSGQYWKITGLLDTTRGGIALTELGNAYASGAITKSEFSAFVIKSIQYPNSEIDSTSTFQEWDLAGLTIKPLELILGVLCNLFHFNPDFGYLTTEELTHVVIPMAGNKYDIANISIGVIEFRNDPTQFAGSWIANDGANDLRIARELLLFLHNYDYLGARPCRNEKHPKTNITQEFYIYDEQYESILSLLRLDTNTLPDLVNESVEAAIQIDKNTQVVDSARERKLVEILSRPSQAKFRKDVLSASEGKCLLTGVAIKEALQACHIVPVKDRGIDDKSNGITLRADLHTLYDKGHIRISEHGKVTISEYLRRDEYYSRNIPAEVIIPDYINLEAIRLRNEYKL